MKIIRMIKGVFKNQETKEPNGRETLIGECFKCGDRQQLDIFEDWDEGSNKLTCIDCVRNTKQESKK